MVPKSEIITLNRLHSIKLKANSTKHKLVKLVVDLSNPRKLPLEEITEAKSEGGMKLYSHPHPQQVTFFPCSFLVFLVIQHF